jgi:hypothetical protein
MLLRNSANYPHKLDDKRIRRDILMKNEILKRKHKIGGPDCLLKTQFSAMIYVIVLGMKLAQCQQYKNDDDI